MLELERNGGKGSSPCQWFRILLVWYEFRAGLSLLLFMTLSLVVPLQLGRDKSAPPLVYEYAVGGNVTRGKTTSQVTGLDLLSPTHILCGRGYRFDLGQAMAASNVPATVDPAVVRQVLATEGGKMQVLLTRKPQALALTVQ